MNNTNDTISAMPVETTPPSDTKAQKGGRFIIIPHGMHYMDVFHNHPERLQLYIMLVENAVRA